METTEQKTLFVEAVIEKGTAAVASTSVMDRQGESIDQAGWDLKNYKKNPVMLWAHDHSIPAIGVAKNIRIEGIGKKAKLLFEPVFHDITEHAKAVKALFDQGVLNSFSVGFMPTDMEENLIKSQELLEISAVNVPANPEARMLAFKALKAKGFDEEVIDGFGLSPSKVEDKITQHDDEIQKLKEQVEFVVKGFKHLAPHAGRSNESAKERLNLLRVLDKVSTSILTDVKAGKTPSVRLFKVFDKVTEKLLIDTKKEING